jgi:cobalt-precorrin-7 (C5)-methyltransferase
LEHRLTIVGIGPGSPDYILPAALKAVEDAPVLIGGARALKTFAKPCQQIYKVDGDIAGLLDFIRLRLQDSDVVVMVSGDPGYYSLLATLRHEVRAENLRVIPGISSFQVAFSRLGLPWQTACLISVHGREPDMSQLEYGEGRILSFLTDGRNHPARIAGWLRQQSWPALTRVWLCRNLSYEDETIMETTLESAQQVSGFDSSVMVVMG